MKVGSKLQVVADWSPGKDPTMLTACEAGWDLQPV